MHIKKLLVILCVIVLPITVKSAHIVGFDLTLQHQTGSLYKIKLTGYRDKNAPGYPNTFSVTIRRKSNNTDALGSNIILTKFSTTPVNYVRTDMAPPGSNGKIEKSVFESSTIDLSSLNDAVGYYIIGQDCCRLPSTNNFSNLLTESAVFTLEMPALGTITNSSPEFIKDPLAFFCVDKSYSFNLNAYDKDGDSLVYSLTTPLTTYSGLTLDTLDWKDGYGVGINILDSYTSTSINRTTGKVEFKPSQIGYYLIAFKVEEYRNGIKIGQVYRDMIFQMSICNEFNPVLFIGTEQAAEYYTDSLRINAINQFEIEVVDTQTDSLEILIVPDTTNGENIFDKKLFKTNWGYKVGQSFDTPQVLNGVGRFIAKLVIIPACSAARQKPYSFMIIARDRTLPVALADTVYYNLYPNYIVNSAPYFVSPDSSYNNTTKTYVVYANENFSFQKDTIIKIKDPDPLNFLTLSITANPINGNDFNQGIIFAPNSTTGQATAYLKLPTECRFIRTDPYEVTITGSDNNCYDPKNIEYKIILYVKAKINNVKEFCHIDREIINNKTVNKVYIQKDLRNNGEKYKITASYDTPPYESFIIANNLTTLVDTFVIDTNEYLRSYFYTIDLINECGFNSATNIHKPIFLSSEILSSSTVKLNWNNYEELDYNTIEIYKNEGSGFNLLTNLNKSITNYTDTSSNLTNLQYYISFTTSDSCVISRNNNLPKEIRSNLLTVLPTSVHSVKTSTLSIFPNPISTEIQLKGINPKIHTEYKIYSILGKLALAGKIHNEHIDLKELEAGPYILLINDLRLKFIKQ